MEDLFLNIGRLAAMDLWFFAFMLAGLLFLLFILVAVLHDIATGCQHRKDS